MGVVTDTPDPAVIPELTPAPPGSTCEDCGHPIADTERFHVMPSMRRDDDSPDGYTFGDIAVHVSCLTRNVMGGIGHLLDHNYWCNTIGDPDAARTKYQSGLEVVAWIEQHGYTAAAAAGLDDPDRVTTAAALTSLAADGYDDDSF